MRTIPLLLLSLSPLAAQTDPAVLTRLLGQYRPTPAAFDFAAIGDQQYGAEGIAKWPALAASINASASQLQFLLHAGDIKSGSTVCDNAMFANRLASFNELDLPVILTPGDNEWTDCYRANNGSFDSLDRLAHLRGVFFNNEESLGKRRIPLFRQSEDPRYRLYRENALWTHGNIVFASLHIVGSNNNLGRNAVNDAEYAARNIANLDWIHTAFSLARDGGFAGVVLIMQANPSFPRLADGPPLVPETGFVDSIYALEAETIAFGKPVLLIHGDSHVFRIDKPLPARKSGRVLENFTRLEVPGSVDVHWVRVHVNPA